MLFSNRNRTDLGPKPYAEPYNKYLDRLAQPDSDKTLWETVQKEPPDKLHRRDGDRFCVLFLSVLGGEGHYTVFEFFNAAVGNGHPVGIPTPLLMFAFFLAFS